MNKKEAVALKYELKKDKAPKVVAKGKGETAENIIKLAKKSGVPIKEDRDLINVLMQIELNKEIPPKLYKAVAEILSFIYKNSK